MGKIINGLSLSKNEVSKRIKNVTKDFTNIKHLRKSYDFRNTRTNSAVDKMRINSGSNNAHLEPLTSKSAAFPKGMFDQANNKRMQSNDPKGKRKNSQPSNFFESLTNFI